MVSKGRGGLQSGFIQSAAVFQAERRISLYRVVCHARSPFDALALLACSGQALGPLVKTRAFGMTPERPEIQTVLNVPSQKVRLSVI
jgi:hypothetical protein